MRKRSKKVQVQVLLTPSERDFLIAEAGVADLDSWCSVQARLTLGDDPEEQLQGPAEEHRTVRVSLSISANEEAALRRVCGGDRAGWLRRLFKTRANQIREAREARLAALTLPAPSPGPARGGGGAP